MSDKKDELVIVERGQSLAKPQEPRPSPLAAYLMRLRSPGSRKTMVSALKAAARIFDDLDRGQAIGTSDILAEDYDWGAPGALTFLKTEAAVAWMAEQENAAGDLKVAYARLMLAGIRGVARAAFNLYLLPIEERTRIEDVQGPEMSGRVRGRRLTSDEIERLRSTCAEDTTPFGKRDAAVLAVMLGTGLRRFEVSELDLEDYRVPDRIGHDPVEFIVRAGKGNKFGEVFAPPDVALPVTTWLEARGDKPGPLFTSSGGKGRPLEGRLSPSGIYRICSERGLQARVDFAPHDLRRTAITVFLERTGDLGLAQKMARHASPETTGRYDKRDREALMKAFAKTKVW